MSTAWMVAAQMASSGTEIMDNSVPKLNSYGNSVLSIADSQPELSSNRGG
jgi:hypothetical protein